MLKSIFLTFLLILLTVTLPLRINEVEPLSAAAAIDNPPPPLVNAPGVLFQGPEGQDPDPNEPAQETAPNGLLAQQVFRNPVVPGATISGYFDHNQGNDYVTFYDGRSNASTAYGFYFQCTTPYMYDFVGCADNVIGEGACANNRELWYDGHKGIDYEFSSNWHTGAYCDPGKFGNLTHPIYAPARGLVQYVGYNHQFNGNHMFILHDANGNGNFYDDGMRAAYLHFATLAVQQGQVVEEGQFLGNGGSTGYSSSPHLHFEVQRSNDGFYSRWSVDPYGWKGSGADPWPWVNETLWKQPAPPPPPPPPPPQPYRIYVPGLYNQTVSLLRNPGFESGNTVWGTAGVDIIVNNTYPSLPIAPYQGRWLAWLGGRNNAADALYQNFTVPNGIRSAVFEYYIQVRTEESDQDIYDRLYVRLRGSDGVTVLRELDAINDNFTPSGQWVRRTFSLGDISAYQGQTLRITFNASTDSARKTSFFIDNATVTASMVPSISTTSFVEEEMLPQESASPEQDKGPGSKLEP